MTSAYTKHYKSTNKDFVSTGMNYGRKFNFFYLIVFSLVEMDGVKCLNTASSGSQHYSSIFKYQLKWGLWNNTLEQCYQQLCT